MIIHELRKESGTTIVEPVFSDELMPNDENSVALITALAESYRGDKILYAVFDMAEGRYFPEQFTIYRNSHRTDDDYVDFSRHVLGNLQVMIQPIPFATGGYFIFAEYVANGQLFNSVFLIRDVEGKILQRTAHSYNIGTVEYVDTKNLAMACRINENRLDGGEGNYLSLTQLRQQVISEYFKNWISIEQVESSGQYTKTLYNIVNNIELPFDEETGEQLSLQTFRNRIYTYATESVNGMLNIRDLSERFYGTPDVLSDYANEHDISIDTEFKYHKREMKRFVKLEVTKDGISLKLSRGTADDKIRFSDAEPNLVIIDSEALANALRNELNDN